MNKRIWVGAAAGLLAVTAGVAGPTLGAYDGGDSGYELGTEGCTPGYWKNHLEAWAGISPDGKVKDVFAIPANVALLGEVTNLQALSFGGGSSVADASATLLRAAVAGVLNATSPDVDYSISAGDLVAQVNAALATGDRATILALKDAIDRANNGGCPL